MFKRKVTLVPKTELTIGEFDPTVDGAYRNVETLPLNVKQGKDLYISLDSDIPVDMALSNSEGRCIGFKDQMRNETFGPLKMTNKETLALLLGVFRGDLAKATIEVWME